MQSQKPSGKTLESTRILLRAPEPEDLQVLYDWENNTQTWQVSNTLSPLSRFVLRQYLETAHKDIYEAKELRLMIDLKISKGKANTIGTLDLFDFDPLHQRAGIGILLAVPEKRRQGYAFEALQLSCDYAFHILQLHQLYCNIAEDNLPSIHLFQKAGFEIVGIKKDWIRYNNSWLDEYLLQLIYQP